MLAAISFVLGASAAAIGRGSSVKDYIGAHGNSTTVRISLMQPEEEAFTFNKQLEGELVIVERTASKAGGSTFKIMDGHGKVISARKHDLDLFKQHFNIQVENPCVFMTQKIAKEFLHKADPAQFLVLFNKATRLEV